MRKEERGEKYLDLDLTKGRMVDMGTTAYKRHSSPVVIPD
jgi:hypothetical protein